MGSTTRRRAQASTRSARCGGPRHRVPAWGHGTGPTTQGPWLGIQDTESAVQGPDLGALACGRRAPGRAAPSLRRQRERPVCVPPLAWIPAAGAPAPAWWPFPAPRGACGLLRMRPSSLSFWGDTRASGPSFLCCPPTASPEGPSAPCPPSAFPGLGPSSFLRPSRCHLPCQPPSELAAPWIPSRVLAALVQGASVSASIPFPFTEGSL